MKISVIHATRRPEKALEICALWNWRKTHRFETEWIFGIDRDDSVSLLLLGKYNHVVCEPGGGNVRAVNAAAAAATGDILMLAADDLYAPQDWDRLLVESLAGYEVAVLATRDGHRQDGLITHPAVTRGWYRKFGFFYPPQFKSVYADAWLTEQAHRDHAIVPAPAECVFEHRHPDFDSSIARDDVYRAGSSPERYAEDWKVLNELLPLRISLCMICGNEEDNIIRCLNSAKGAFDELCLVRATGCLPPDNSELLARQWCHSNGKTFTFKSYANKEATWPHVDDFAAARNLSFSLATCDWILWLDCDDVLDEINCRRIREAALTRQFDALYCTYLIARHGAELERERLIRRGAGRWHGAVHEVCKIDGQSAHCPQIRVEHRPGGKAHLEQSARRNASILALATEDSPRHYFYLHADLKALGRPEESIHAGLAALALLDDNRVEERYQVLLNLSELQHRTDRMLEALALQPHRREALAFLCQECLERGQVSSATSYFRLMDALPAPSPLPWTHQGIWYPDGHGNPGWGRNLLRVRILHASGQAQLAQAEHERYLADPEYAAAAVKFKFERLTPGQWCEPTEPRHCPQPEGDGTRPGAPQVPLEQRGLPVCAQ